MNLLTLKIPEELDQALRSASRLRGLSKSAVVREALEHSLGRKAQRTSAAQRWATLWRGQLAVPPPSHEGKTGSTDNRLSHLLAKHVR